MPPMTSLYFRACTIYKPFAFSHFHLQQDGVGRSHPKQQTMAGQGCGAESRGLFIHTMWEIWMRLVRLKIVRFSEIFMRLHGKKKLPRSMDKVFPVFHSHIIRVCVCLWVGGSYVRHGRRVFWANSYLYLRILYGKPRVYSINIAHFCHLLSLFPPRSLHLCLWVS